MKIEDETANTAEIENEDINIDSNKDQNENDDQKQNHNQIEAKQSEQIEQNEQINTNQTDYIIYKDGLKDISNVFNKLLRKLFIINDLKEKLFSYAEQLKNKEREINIIKNDSNFKLFFKISEDKSLYHYQEYTKNKHILQELKKEMKQ
jgi:hypothetical protein